MIRRAFERAAVLDSQSGDEPGAPSKMYRDAWAGRLERAGEWGVTRLIEDSKQQ